MRNNSFYTNVQCFGNAILFRGILDGKRVKQKIDYSPSLFLLTNRETEYKTLNGQHLQQKIFGNIREAKEYVKQFENVSNAPEIYGNQAYQYAYIAEQHRGMIEWDIDKLSIAIIDIEVGSENGFPDPYLANEQITAIALRYLNGKTYVFGCGDYDIQGEEEYIKCKDEWTLCKKFLQLWSEKCPDVITGWNTKGFDIPYIVNRFNKILGEQETRKLSPWNFISEKKSFMNNRNFISYDFVGISSLDYLELYRWFAPGGKSQENYRLDTIANVELDERKLSYDEYDSLHELYKLNFQKFIEYNIKDVDLIVRMEDKMKLIELALTLAYDTKSNFDDVFTQTRMWDALSYSYLLERNIIVPPKVTKHKDDAFEGAYVKEVQSGLHEYIASFDLNSLYPHLIMQYNLSPETLIEPYDYTPEMREIISSGVTVNKLLKKEVDISKLTNATLTPNGQFFRTDIRGFLPQMMDDMYEDRKKFKKLMLRAKQEKENETDRMKIKEIEKRIARYDNLQTAKKLSLNSAYGALGSQYFRFYDLRMALAVTSAGQLSIRWIENKLNQYMNNLLNTDKDYVIASDTDSIYLRLSELVHKVYGTDGKINLTVNKAIEFMDRICEDKIQPYIDKTYQELADYVHAYEQKMQMKREALANKGVWTAKKRYILNVYNNEGVQYKEPVQKVMGLEMVKSSTPTSVRNKMKEVIKIMMLEDESSVQNFVAKFKESFKQLPPEEISFPRSVNGLSKYSDSLKMYKGGTPIHVRGSIIYNHYLKEMELTKKYPLIQEGDKLKFTYLKLPNPFKESVISYPSRLPAEFQINKYVDYDTQFEKTFLEPIKVITDCMGWNIEPVNSLESFFS
jgi:DNA polymerase elongation subunit (family B)